jgi:hypothetical protein
MSSLEGEVGQLSAYKSAQWINSHTLMMTKKAHTGGLYKVYWPVEACQGLLSKYDKIMSEMEKLKRTGLSTPVNIEVFDSECGPLRIVQLSLYRGEPNFGLHIWLPGGSVAVGRGMNFQNLEWLRLVEIMKLRPIENIVDSSTSAKRLFIPVKVYTWSWVPTDDEHKEVAPLIPTLFESDKSYLRPELCFLEACRTKPQGSYESNCQSRVVHIELDNELIDTVLARVLLGKSGDRALSDDEDALGDDLADVRRYGQETLEDLHLMSMYTILSHLISLSESPTGQLFAEAMNLLMKRGKQEIVLNQLLTDPSAFPHLDLIKQIMV